MSDEVLKPCPICGKKVSIARTDNEVGERWWFITRGTYRTTRCNCRLFLESEKFTCDWNDDYALECRAKLIDKWNTRAPVEHDGWFYLPKPKESVVQYGEQRTEKTEHGYKVTQPVEVLESAIRSWGDELGEYIMKRICEAWNTRTHGTLTAEQVEKAIHDCSTYASYDGCTYYASGIRLQAIADELNATLGSGTCECVAEYAESPIDGKTIVLHRCSACHELMRPFMNYCPNCGKRIRKTV